MAIIGYAYLDAKQGNVIPVVGIGSGRTGYTTIEDEGSPLPQQTVLNFVGDGVTASDGGSSTTVTIPGGGGSGSVTTVSVVTANGVSGTVADPTTTPAITLELDDIVPDSVAAVGTVTGSNLSGTNTGDQTSVTGNSGTATALQTSRNINGVPFDGTANITVPAAAGTLTGTTLATGVVTSSLTSVGTLTNLTVTNPVTGSITGNSATATALQTARTINGVPFDGTANIVVSTGGGFVSSAAFTCTAQGVGTNQSTTANVTIPGTATFAIIVASGVGETNSLYNGHITVGGIRIDTNIGSYSHGGMFLNNFAIGGSFNNTVTSPQEFFINVTWGATVDIYFQQPDLAINSGGASGSGTIYFYS